MLSWSHVEASSVTRWCTVLCFRGRIYSIRFVTYDVFTPLTVFTVKLLILNRQRDYCLSSKPNIPIKLIARQLLSLSSDKLSDDSVTSLRLSRFEGHFYFEPINSDLSRSDDESVSMAQLFIKKHTHTNVSNWSRTIC